MVTEFLTEGRVKPLRRLLMVGLGLSAVVALLAIPLLVGDLVRYGVVVLVVAAALATAAWVTLRAVRDGAETARRLCVLTGALYVLLSLPLMPIWLGLLTVVLGIAVLFVTLARDQA